MMLCESSSNRTSKTDIASDVDTFLSLLWHHKSYLILLVLSAPPLPTDVQYVPLINTTDRRRKSSKGRYFIPYKTIFSAFTRIIWLPDNCTSYLLLSLI